MLVFTYRVIDANYYFCKNLLENKKATPKGGLNNYETGKVT
jgi:hypothetical protein